MDLFAVTGVMCGDLGGLPAITSGSLQIFANLLTPRTRSVEIFLGVALDLWRSASANGDFIPELLQSVRQFGLIDDSGKLLRSEKALWLDRPWLTILALGQIENDRMGMQLWRNIPIHWTSCIVLKFGGDEFARSLWRMVPADAGLRIVLELFKGCGDALSVRLTHTIIASPKSRQRNRLWGGKGSVPSGPVLHCLYRLSVGTLVLVGRSLSNKLFACLRVLALAELSKILCRNRTGKPELCSETPLPLARDHTPL